MTVCKQGDSSTTLQETQQLTDTNSTGQSQFPATGNTASTTPSNKLTDRLTDSPAHVFLVVLVDERLGPHHKVHRGRLRHARLPLGVLEQRVRAAQARGGTTRGGTTRGGTTRGESR